MRRGSGGSLWASIIRMCLGVNSNANRPGWSRKREHYQPIALPPKSPRSTEQVPYAELHCHSTFSFLDGASEPEELAEEAAKIGLEALAITDHDGFYGVVRFGEAAGELGIRT